MWRFVCGANNDYGKLWTGSLTGMHIPAAFRVEDFEQLSEFIHAHGFAVLVSATESGQPPIATHLPLMLSDRDGVPILLGHVAKANPQWQMADGQSVLAIFHGPHSFISAGWYGRQNAVPTWNYVAVHVTGTLRITNDRNRLSQIVRELTNKYESALSGENSTDGQLAEPWSLDSVDPAFLDGMLNGIVGFEISVEQIEGCWKLNQHHDDDRRQRVAEALRRRGDEHDEDIAALMQSDPNH